MSAPAIQSVKNKLRKHLVKGLCLKQIGCPLFFVKGSGLQDTLSGEQVPVTFTHNTKEYEIVHSLAKWKRIQLQGIAPAGGILCDMKAIRNEETSPIHALQVEQFDWEVRLDNRKRDFYTLQYYVHIVYNCLKEVIDFLPNEITFIDLANAKRTLGGGEEDMVTTAEVEEHYTKLYGAIFLFGIGGEDGRAPDYDDWTLNGDIIINYMNRPLELSSMGIRVDRVALEKQFPPEVNDWKEWHHNIDLLPASIGGGIGQDRVAMAALGLTDLYSFEHLIE